MGAQVPIPGSWTSALSGATSSLVTQKTSIAFSVLVQQIEQLTAMAQSKIAQIKSKGSAMSIGDMFDLQMSMNILQQFSEMSTSVISAMNSSVNSMARNVKG